MKRIRASASIVFWILLMGGCQVVMPPEERPLRRPRIETFVVGRSVESRPIECVVVGEGSDVILIIASIHGDEASGTPLVRHLIKVLAAGSDLGAGSRVVIIPEANPDGMAHRTRFNARGIDLNRNFSAANWLPSDRTGEVPLSEPESRAIAKVIRAYRPNRIVSIHEPYECIDFDGPGEAMALKISESGNLPLRKLGGKPGSLGSFAGDDRGIPTITLELPGYASDLSVTELWDAYGGVLLAAVQYRHPSETADIGP